MMQLTSVTVIKNLTAKTENGNYQIEHHVVSGILQKVLVTAFSSDGEQFIGSINLENGTTSCSFPTEVRLTLILRTLTVLWPKSKRRFMQKLKMSRNNKHSPLLPSIL